MKRAGIVILMLGLLTVSGVTAFSTTDKDEKGEYIAKAQQYSEKEYHKDAILCYQEALELDPENVEIQGKIAHEYLLAGEGRKAVSLLEDLENEPDEDGVMAADLVCGYLMTKDTQQAVTKAKEATEKYPQNETLQYLYKETRGINEEDYILYQPVSDQRDGYTVARNSDGKLCIYDAKDKEYLKKTAFDAIDDYIVLEENGTTNVILSVHDLPGEAGTGAEEDKDPEEGADPKGGADPKEDTVPKKGTNYRYIDKDGFLRFSPRGSYSYLGCPRDGRVLIRDEKGWGYLDDNFTDLGVRFEDATAFAEGVAAVRENGKWRIVTPDTIKEATGDVKWYDDVVKDAWKVCSISGNVFVKTGAGYQLVTPKGEVVSETYDKVKAFTEKKGTAAVSKDSKWGLIDAEGKLICPLQYEETGSGGTTLAAYRSGNLWGYIDRAGEVYVEAKYAVAGCMNDAGKAYVTLPAEEGKETDMFRIEMLLFHKTESSFF